jgi:hypothetical protein
MGEKECANAGFYCRRGYEKYCCEKYYDAILDFTRAIQLRPDCGAAYNNRANIFVLLDYTHSAKMDFSIAAELGFPVDPKNLKRCQQAKPKNDIVSIDHKEVR